MIAITFLSLGDLNFATTGSIFPTLNLIDLHLRKKNKIFCKREGSAPFGDPLPAGFGNNQSSFTEAGKVNLVIQGKRATRLKRRTLGVYCPRYLS